MNSRFRFLLAGLVLVAAMLVQPSAIAAPDAPSVVVGDQQLLTQGHPSVELQGDRVFVPVADFAATLGVTWSWNDATQVLTFAGQTVTYNFKPAPYTISGVPYAPVRVLAELTGAHVTWIPSARLIMVQPAQRSLYDLAGLLQGKQFVDLTHTFGPGIPHWYGFGDEQVQTLYTYDKAGFYVQQFTHVGQWGTHVDPPAHFHEGLRTVDQIPVSEMVLPLVVLDVHEQVAKNPDYTVTMEDVKAWEAKHGQVPAGAFVALRTDWSKRWPDQDKMLNKDAAGTFHYPGWSKEVLQYLYEARKITASGHETTDTDPGSATTHDDYSLESYILSLNHYQIELLANLDQVPEAGAIVVVSFPKPQDGSGFPARVFAILP
jgi:kynurenine formamidase